MRILQVCSEYPPQKVFGLGRYVADLSRALASKGHSVHVLTNSIGGLEQDAIVHGVQLHRVDFPPPPMPPTPGAPVMAFNVHLQQRANALGRSGLGDPDVIVSHDWLTAVAAHRIASRLDLPHVWTVHDTVYGKRFGQIDGMEDELGFAVEAWAAKSVDLILVNSRAIGSEIEKAYGADPALVELLYPGLSEEAFEIGTTGERLQMFRSLFADPDELLITFAGRLDVEKGVDTLLTAFSGLKEKRPKVRLAIAGKGVLQSTIEDHIRRLNLEALVMLCGYLEGDVLRSFYAASDIHVCPSHYEPFGLVALEAMAVGTPVVVSNTGGLQDIVSSGKVGRRVPPGDAGALLGSLMELTGSEDIRRRLGTSGRNHVRKTFSWSGLASRAHSLYTQAAERKAVVRS